MHFKRKLSITILATFLLAACNSGEEGSPIRNNQVNNAGNTPVSEENVSQERNTEVEENNTVETNSLPLVAKEPLKAVKGGASQGILPVSLEIPAIGIEASISDVGLEEDGAMEVPDDGDLVGWFDRGAKPGAKGNAVLAGHVDDRTGPAIFYELTSLEVGDEIYVTDEEGTTLTFQVKDRAVYPYDDAPISKVFGGSSSKNLNLITCTGEFDRTNGTHRERLVIFTELVEEA